MATNGAAFAPVMPSAQEEQAIKALAQALGRTECAAVVMGMDGERIPLPESVYRLLRAMLELMKDGLAVQLVPFHQELTTQEAAEILNVSRPHLIKLLENGAMPFRLVGTHRRVRFGDVMAYREQQANERAARLTELTRQSEDAGLYDQDYSAFVRRHRA